MSRDWLLYLDDLIASAEKIGRLVGARDAAELRADEAAFDAVLFNLQVIGESFKQLPQAQLAQLPEVHRSGPARLRDLIAHHYFALDPSVIHDVATRHVPDLLVHAVALRQHHDTRDIKRLKGFLAKPETPVSIEDMNRTMAERRAKAGKRR